MTPRDFVYWLRGYIELSGEDIKHGMNEEQVKMINQHLDLVFSMGGPNLYAHGDKYIDGSSPLMSCSFDGKPKETIMLDPRLTPYKK